MKYILSRKGFDSQCGGHPSPVLPDGTMLSLPIPELDSTQMNCNSGCRYSDLELKGFPIEDSFCHLDPDIRPELNNNNPWPDGWRPALGQCGPAARHLQNQKIGAGDIFLFFGLFQQWQPDKGFYGQPFHAIWGYMQIAEVIDLQQNEKARSRYSWHPHTMSCLTDGKKEHLPNLLYIGSEQLTFAPALKGYGVFYFNDTLKLTISNETRVTHWRYKALPWIDQKNPTKHPMTYHSEKSCQKQDYFQAACRGQEFVIPEDKSDIVTKHFKKLLELK